MLPIPEDWHCKLSGGQRPILSSVRRLSESDESHTDSLSADNSPKGMKRRDYSGCPNGLKCVNQKQLDGDAAYEIICANYSELSGLP